MKVNNLYYELNMKLIMRMAALLVKVSKMNFVWDFVIV